MDNETYSIPMVINWQISRQNVRRVANPRMLVQGGDKKQMGRVEKPCQHPKAEWLF